MAPAVSSERSRSTCDVQYVTSAWRAVRCDSVFSTVAVCFSGSIWSSGAPAFTTSPDFTKIFRMDPSTCGWTLVECRERTVEMNSDASSIGVFWSVTMPTGVAGGGPPRPCPGAPGAPPLAAPPPQAPDSTVPSRRMRWMEEWIRMMQMKRPTRS